MFAESRRRAVSGELTLRVAIRNLSAGWLTTEDACGNQHNVCEPTIHDSIGLLAAGRSRTRFGEDGINFMERSA